MTEFKIGNRVRIRTPEDIEEVFDIEAIHELPHTLLVEFGNKKGYIAGEGREYEINLDDENDNPEHFLLVDKDDSELILEKISFIPEELFSME